MLVQNIWRKSSLGGGGNGFYRPNVSLQLPTTASMHKAQTFFLRTLIFPIPLHSRQNHCTRRPTCVWRASCKIRSYATVKAYWAFWSHWKLRSSRGTVKTQNKLNEDFLAYALLGRYFLWPCKSYFFLTHFVINWRHRWRGLIIIPYRQMYV